MLGRSPYCSIVLSNPQSSRQHCALRLDAETLTIVDLNSANGTWVNDVRVREPLPLGAGDVIRVGTDVLEVLPADDVSAQRGRPTTHQRKAMSTGPDDSTNHMGFDDAPQTQTTASQLELVEALVASASETRRPMTLAPMIQRTLESLIHQHTQLGRRLAAGDATRLAAVIEIVASFSPPELNDWRKSMLAKLESHTGSDHQSSPSVSDQ